LKHAEHPKSGLSRCPKGHVFSYRRYGAVCPYCFSVLEGDLSGMPENKLLLPLEPVVGWLVCLSGVNRGRDYRLVAEKNFIGQAPDMHIRILGDDQIKVKKHGAISYDPMNGKTTLIPDTGTMILNNERVFRPVTLNDGDVMTIGDGMFKLILFCNNHLTWEEQAGEWQLVQTSPFEDDLTPPEESEQGDPELSLTKEDFWVSAKDNGFDDFSDSNEEESELALMIGESKEKNDLLLEKMDTTSEETD